MVVGLAVGMYGLSFGVIAVATGLSIWQAVALSSIMFTGGSQFAYIGVLGAGGSSLAAAAAALLLGAPNTFYGVAMKPLLPTRGWRQVAAAQLTIDESTAMALSRADATDPRAARTAFWGDWRVRVRLLEPRSWGRSGRRRWATRGSGLGRHGAGGLPGAAVAAARFGTAVGVALVAATVAVLVSLVTPPGIPVPPGGVVAAVAALLPARGDADSSPSISEVAP